MSGVLKSRFVSAGQREWPGRVPLLGHRLDEARNALKELLNIVQGLDRCLIELLQHDAARLVPIASGRRPLVPSMAVLAALRGSVATETRGRAQRETSRCVKLPVARAAGDHLDAALA